MRHGGKIRLAPITKRGEGGGTTRQVCTGTTNVREPLLRCRGYGDALLNPLLWRGDAKGQTTTIDYDVLGRMVERTDDATGSPETVTWVYDTATAGIGKLASSANLGYQKVITYDGLGRPSTTTDTINGTASDIATTYDAYSRPKDLVYPSGLTVRNEYTNGHLAKVTKPDGTPYWEALERDARGNIIRFRLGNGVESLRTHDPKTGRLTGAYADRDTGLGTGHRRRPTAGCRRRRSSTGS
ncbi:MAG: hypothetical protein GY798_16755 [Hyphomicrobiales bacterium]|nr:hypothetical protein [Hyphomicrobiales bacterium]